jgi:hypothetical protein
MNDKKTTAKAQQVKKGAAAGKGNAAAEQELRTLQTEFKKLLQFINAEGLRFLIRQAQVLIHNQQIDKVNVEIDKLNALQQQLVEQTGSRETPGLQAGKSAVVDKRVLDVEEAGSHFVLVLGSNRKMLSRDEMGSLVKVALAAESKADGAARIFNWLTRNRQDVIYDLRIKSKSDARLAELAALLKKRYQGRG